MEANFINSFIKAAAEVIKQEIQVEINRGTLSVGTTEFTTDEINALIGVVGNLEGQVFYSCTKESARKMISVMAGEELPEYTPMVSDGFAELANVISGRATVLLEMNGYRLNLTPPTLIEGYGVKIGTLSIQTINVPLTTRYGAFNIKVGLRPKADKV